MRKIDNGDILCDVIEPCEENDPHIAKLRLRQTATTAVPRSSQPASLAPKSRGAR